jgi:hypothetical protein
MDSTKIEANQYDLTNGANTTQPQSTTATTATTTTANSPRSRITSWLSQHFPAHENEVPSPSFSSSWIGARKASTLSSISMTSHLSTDSAGQRRASSVPDSPTSPTLPRLSLKLWAPTKSAKLSNNNNMAKSGRLLSHATVSGSSNHELEPLSGLTTYNDDKGAINDNYSSYETSSGSNNESMDERLDEINDNSSDSVYYEDWNDGNNSMCSSDDIGGIDNGKRHSSYSTDGGNFRLSETMDPKVARALLAWQRKSTLNISWYAGSNDMQLKLWNEEQHTSILNLELYGMRLDDAFR